MTIKRIKLLCINSSSFFVLSVFFLVPFVLNAQNNFSPLCNFITGLLSLFQILVVIIFSLSLIFFLWNMAIFILNAGNEEKRKEGKKRMIWGVVILTVMVGIWGIVNIFLTAFGISGGGENLLFLLTPR